MKTSFDKTIEAGVNFGETINPITPTDKVKIDNFEIHKNYNSRNLERFLNTEKKTDQYQNLVYKYLHEIVTKKTYKNIVDIGCGSGYKLIKYFNDYNTIGYELKETVKFLKDKYPNKKWAESTFSNNINSDCDAIICADVIEHLIDPNQLLDWINLFDFKELVISTPNRDLLVKNRNVSNDGPPHNKYHIREWSFTELENYMKRHFRIINHFNIEKEACQVIHCVKKKKISILVPAYKTQDFIEECLDSIENQTYFINNDDYEILVGVDGCQDTLNKLQKIRHKYRNLRIFMMKKNMGLFVTLNTLHKINDSEHIIKFDSDDIMKPNMIDEIFKHVNGYGIVRFSSDNFNDGSKTIIGSSSPHGVFYMKKTVYDDLGGYKPWICAADTDFMYRLDNRHKEKTLPLSLFLRRMHENSLTQAPETGKKSKIRETYNNQFERGYMYVTPTTNKYFEIKGENDLSMFGGWSIDIECYKKILEILPTGKTILEFGSGRSTNKLSETYTMYSVEHDADWVGKYNSTYIHAPIEIETSEVPSINWYSVDALKKGLPSEYDLILVDGPVGALTSNGMTRDGFRRNKHLFNLNNTIIVFDDIQRQCEMDSMKKLVKELDREVEIFNSGTDRKNPKKFGVIYPHK